MYLFQTDEEHEVEGDGHEGTEVVVHHDNGVHLAGDMKEVYWGSSAFIVLVALIAWKFGPAIKKMVASRPERIEAELEAAKAARTEAEAALNASTADLPDVGAEEVRIRDEALETASRLKVDMAAKADADAEALKARGVTDVANMKRQALTDLQDEVATITRDATEAIVTEGLDEAAHAELIENYINQVGQLS